MAQQEWTEAALTILAERYLHRRQDGSQETPGEMIWRVAAAIAWGDTKYGSTDNEVQTLAEGFYALMSSGQFWPNSPTLMNAGLLNGLQYSACYVLPVEDSLEEIFNSVQNAVRIHKSGGGTGFSFSRLRPNGSRVNTSGGVASGPVSFMSVFDSATEVIKQGGRRRGANMGVLRVDHPDIEEFITCKRDGGITNFNISVAVTNDFMEALKGHGDYDLDYDLIAQPGWPALNGKRHKGGEVVGQKNAREIFRLIVDAAWRTGDPGLLFIDRINDSPANPTPEVGLIEATNPCGESPLLPNEACNLGSINLAKFVDEVDEGCVDWSAMGAAVRTAIHFLDNVITVNPYAVPQIEETVLANRRIGLGVMGWADMLFALRIPYDSPEALSLGDDVMRHIKRVARNKGEQLAASRGAFPNWERSLYREGAPLRNATVTAIAPTGSISIIAGASSGIEPIFALAYRHAVRRPDGGRLLTFVNAAFERVAREGGFWNEELRQKIFQNGSVQGLDEVPAEVQKIFKTAHEIEPHWHVRMQAAFQAHTDMGVSKTVNLPHDASRQEIVDVYLLAYETGCLGITVFRDGCKGDQVLKVGVKEQPAASDSNTRNTAKVRPITLGGNTYRKKTPVGTAYVTVNTNGADGEPFEVFINVGKAGSDVASVAEGLGRLISLILRMPGSSSTADRARDIVAQLRGIGSGRAQGFGKQRVMSLPDAIGQALAEHVGFETTGQLPRLPDVEDGVPSPPPGDLCPECGQATLVAEEGCRKCHGCGFSEC